MNIQRDTEYRFGELVQSPEYSNEQGVVVMIKSLATGQTMKVYLDEPTQRVDKNGINVTTYTGHFNQKEFMVTLSEGFELTGLPLMYPYDATGDPDVTTVIDTQNHSITISASGGLNPVNIASNQISFGMQDFPSDVETPPTSGNAVMYDFTRPASTSDDKVGPTIPDPGEVVVTPGGEELGPTQK